MCSGLTGSIIAAWRDENGNNNMKTARQQRRSSKHQRAAPSLRLISIAAWRGENKRMASGGISNDIGISENIVAARVAYGENASWRKAASLLLRI